jgi:hypothetical protein
VYSFNRNGRDGIGAEPDPTRFQVEAILAECIPESVQVVLHEESLTHIHLTIPAGENLSGTDLELVAGAGWEFGGGACNCDGGTCAPEPY